MGSALVVLDGMAVPRQTKQILGFTISFAKRSLCRLELASAAITALGDCLLAFEEGTSGFARPGPGAGVLGTSPRSKDMLSVAKLASNAFSALIGVVCGRVLVHNGESTFCWCGLF